MNCFQTFFLHHNADNLPSVPLPTSGVDSFDRVSGRKLNPSQITAVKNAQSAISFVIGPPGTGKTFVMTAVIHTLLVNGKGILVLGQTNGAVKAVYDCLLKNGVCTTRQLTLLVSHEYLKLHKNEYGKIRKPQKYR